MLFNKMNGHSVAETNGDIAELPLMEKPANDKKAANQRKRCFQKIGGFDLISRRPMIDSVNKQLFVASGRTIRQYSTDTGSFQRDFTFQSRSDIISLTLNPLNNREYIVVDEDGLVLHWDYVDNIKTNEASLPLAGKKITFFEQIYDEYYFVIPCKSGKAGQLFFSNRMCLNQPYMAICREDFVAPNAHQSVCFGPTERPKYCAVIFESQLMIYEIPVRVKSQLKKHIYDTKKYGKTLTCVAFHPVDDCVATGDSKGMIVIWNGLLQPTPTRTILHWHAQAVNDLAFSIAGTHLFSGGSEMVLVKWNVIGQDYGKKDFLPRLGMPINLISMDPEQEMIIASLEDQTLVIIDGQMNSGDKIIEGLTNGCDDRGELPAGIHYSMKNKTLALNGRTGHLQFYSPIQQKLVSQLDICNQNIVSAVSTKTDREIAKEKKEAKKSGEKVDGFTDKLHPINVTKLAISDKGDWMATVEHRDDGKAFMENRLKFWNYSENKFNLVTVVQLPHLDEITFTAFSPQVPSLSKIDGEQNNDLHFVTCSKDGSFQVWDLNTGNSRPQGWSSEKVGVLDNVSVPRMAAFSHDATLLTVIFGNTVTLWKNSPKGLELIMRNHLSNINDKKAMNADILLAKFGVGQKTYFFLLATSEEVVVYDALKGFQIIYSHTASPKEPFEKVDFDARHNIIALVTSKSLRFLELNKKNIIGPIPLHGEHNSCGKIVATCFGTDLLDSHLKIFNNLEFYLVNDRNEIFHVVQIAAGERIEKYQSTILVSGEESESTKALMHQIRSGYESELSKILAASMEVDDEEVGDDKKKSKKKRKEMRKAMSRFNLTRSKLVEKFFDSVPTHVMPEPSVFDEPYLEALNRAQEDITGEDALEELQTSAAQQEDGSDGKMSPKPEVEPNNRLDSRFHGVEWI